MRDLKNQVKSEGEALEQLSESAHGLIMREGHFSLVSIRFDPDSKLSAIENVVDIGKSLANASTKVKHAVIDRLVEINKRRG